MTKRIGLYLLIASGTACLSYFIHILPFLNYHFWFVGYSDIIFFSQKNLAAEYTKSAYPALTNLLIGLFDPLKSAPLLYYTLNCLLLFFFFLITTYFLFRISQESWSKKRLWFWFFSPSLIFFLFYNWDILALFFVVVAFYCVKRGKLISASGLFAIGFCTKFFPILFLVPLFLTAKKLQEKVMIVLTFVSLSLLVNVFFAWRDFASWSFFWQYNANRNPNLDSLWGIINHSFPQLSINQINLVSLVFFGLGTALILYFKKGFFLQSFLLTLLFLLTNKILSPQYFLWLLPFVVFLPSNYQRLFVKLELLNIVALLVFFIWSFYLKVDALLILFFVLISGKYLALGYFFLKVFREKLFEKAKTHLSVGF